MLRVSDGVADCIRLAIPQPTEWRRIGDEIEAAFIFARVDFVKMTTTLRLHQAATVDSVPAQDRFWRGPRRGKGAILCVATLVASIRLLQQFYL